MFMGLPTLSPIENISCRNELIHDPSPSNHDHNYGLGVVTLIVPIGKSSHHRPLNFINENNNAVEKSNGKQHAIIIMQPYSF